MSTETMNADQVRAFVSACWPQAMQSPFAQAVRVACAVGIADIASAEAAWGASDTAVMLTDAESLADTWRHLGLDEWREQVDSHLESDWPDASEELRSQIVARVCV